MNGAGRVKKRYFVKENKKPLTAIKTTSKDKNVLGYEPKRFNV